MVNYKNNIKANRRNFLDDQLKEKYPRIDKLINKRRSELVADYVSKGSSVDYSNNIGSSKNGSFVNSTENLNISFTSDPVIIELEKLRQAYLDLLEFLNDDDKEIFYLRWGLDTQYEWVDVYEILKHSDKGYMYRYYKQVSRRRDFILDKLAELLHII
ncbi:hypothetical protein [Streptococcus uberis]|uniref:hypothetical protein n=1 Tax=Streptococcus uberis TaxID=1349 RepID=UPI00193962AE|nr:hypothetical protein [Streptococcus uberis]